jgi:dTMP kinase
LKAGKTPGCDEPMEKGLFITFEGPDASGKSTQISLLAEYLKECGYEAVLAREPGSTDIGEQIRRIILDTDNVRMDYIAETLLYAAARAQLVSEVIRPALSEGRIVICDRFVDSSLAYQGYGRELGDIVETINAFSVRECMPDITFLLNISPELSASRRNGRENDRIENEDEEYHTAVCSAYEDLAKRYPQRIVGIEGRESIQVVNHQVINHIRPLLYRHINDE